MKVLTLGRLAVLTFLLCLLAACAPKEAAQIETDQDDILLQVYLVRHAEKTADEDDPALTEAGQARAELLADLLAYKGITRIHSSDYRRTRDTAAPLAARLGVKVELYDPRDLPAMAAKLKEAGGTHLVVGHSNTTPQLTELLGGDGREPIVEAYEYDRLYVVTYTKNDELSSQMIRFGESRG